MSEHISQGFRLKREQLVKLGELASALNCTRNRAMGILIDNATVETQTVERVTLNANLRSGEIGEGERCLA